MREMQEKAFEARSAQYLLLKAPPASGKSRALMFLALDKLINQGIKKSNSRCSLKIHRKFFCSNRVNKIWIFC